MRYGQKAVAQQRVGTGLVDLEERILFALQVEARSRSDNEATAELRCAVFVEDAVNARPIGVIAGGAERRGAGGAVSARRAHIGGGADIGLDLVSEPAERLRELVRQNLIVDARRSDCPLLFTVPPDRRILGLRDRDVLISDNHVAVIGRGGGRRDVAAGRSRDNGDADGLADRGALKSGVALYERNESDHLARNNVQAREDAGQDRGDSVRHWRMAPLLSKRYPCRLGHPARALSPIQARAESTFGASAPY